MPLLYECFAVAHAASLMDVMDVDVMDAASLMDVTATWLLSVLPSFLPQADQKHLVCTLTAHLYQCVPCVM